jgi:hypothetical protein
MKKLVLGLIGSILAISASSFMLLPISANAATYTWDNAFRITDGSTSYFNGNAKVNWSSDTWQSSTQATFGSCASSNYITSISSDGKTGVLHTFTGTGGNDCTDTHHSTITITQTQLQQSYLGFQDKNTITSGNGRRSFNFTGDGTYTEDGSDLEDGNGQAGCLSSITILKTDGAGKVIDTPGNATLVIRAAGGDSKNLNSYSAYIRDKYNIFPGNWIIGDGSGKTPGSCWSTNPIPIYLNSGQTNGPSNSSPAVNLFATTPNGGPSCGDTSGFAWLICPAITGIGSLTTGLYTSFVEPLLEVNPLSTASTDPLYAIWGVFRSLADVLFVVIFLIIIFATSISVGVDSYTVKKILPRLVVAAILVQFSYFLCGVMVDIGNVLGQGILSLVHATISSAHSAKGSAAANPVVSGLTVLVPTAGVALVAGSAIGAPTILLALVGLLIGIVVFVVTLSVRQLLINVLIILSPVAIVLWIMPNTSKLFNTWRDNFIKIILMFPIISLLFGAGLIVSAVAQSQNGGTIGTVLGMLGPIIALCLMPMTFKMAGSAMSTVSGVAGRLGKQSTSSLKGSQFAKDMKATSKGKKAVAYQNSTGLSRVMRGTAVGGVGGMLGTASSKRRIAVLAGAHEKNRMDEIGQQGRDLDSAQALAVIKGQDGQTVHGVKVDNFARRVMVDKLADKVATSELEEAKEHMGDALFSSAMNQSSNKSEIFKKAPHLVGGNYEAINSGRLADLDEVGAQGLLNHLGAQKDVLASATASAPEKTKAQRDIKAFEGALAGLAPAQKGNANNKAVHVVHGGKTSDGSGGGSAYDAPSASDGTIFTSTADVQEKIDNATGRYL